MAVHHADGTIILEQSKSALSQNPISDWSDDLWKTVANWIALVTAGTTQINKTHFHLYVTPVKEGARAQELSAAREDADIAAIIAAIEQDLRSLAKPPSCETHLRCLIDAPMPVQVGVIAQFKLISTDADPVDPIRALLAPTVQAPLIDHLCQFAIGRAKELADRLIRDGKPANIDADEFKATFRAFVQKNNLPGFLSSLSQVPPIGAIESLLSSGPTFVKQLDLVRVNDDERLRAVSDFLRASADKSSWAAAGLVFGDDFKDWDADLISRHGLICGEVEDVHGDKEPYVRGRIAYRRCALLQSALDGRAVPGHFVHGYLNELADTRKIGWHPDYKDLLGKEGT